MASGATLLTLVPAAFDPPVTDPATWGLRNSTPHLDFAEGANYAAIWSGVVLPTPSYGGGGIRLKIHWRAATATTGVVVWGGSIERQVSQDQDSDGFGAETTVASSATNGTSGVENVTDLDLTSGTNMDSLAAGEAARIKIRRLPGDASDTMVGSAELTLIEIREI